MLLAPVLLVAWIVNGALNLFGALTRNMKVDRPLDGGLIFIDGRRILGSSTTLGGLALCLSASLALSPYKYLFFVPVLVYLGHALGSFLKRRLGYTDGQFLPGIDHGDYALLIGAVFVPLGYLTILDAVLMYVLSILITPLVTWCAYTLRLRHHKL